MGRYYYHGIDCFFGAMGYTVEIMIKILESEGIKSRCEVQNRLDERYNHVCLYRKNEEYDYTSSKFMFNSARGGWIDGNFVFVISPDIQTEKVYYGKREFDQLGNFYPNLVDEWRSVGGIPSSKIVGLALPWNAINEYLKAELNDVEELEDQRKLILLLPKLQSLADKMGIFITSSEIENFTDTLDEQLYKSIRKVR